VSSQRFVSVSSMTHELSREAYLRLWPSTRRPFLRREFSGRYGIVETRMPRGTYISVSVIAVLLLLKPFDCFGNGQVTQKGACCHPRCSWLVGVTVTPRCC
jgi:hypothetical protein